MVMINGSLGVETAHGELEFSSLQTQRGAKRKHHQLADVESDKSETLGSSRQQQCQQPPEALMTLKAPHAVPSHAESLDSDKGTSQALGPKCPARITKSSCLVANDGHKAAKDKKRKHAKLEATLLNHALLKPTEPEPPIPRPPVPEPVPITDSSGNIQAFMAVQDPPKPVSNISAILNPEGEPGYSLPQQAPKVHLLPPTLPSIDDRESPESPLDLSSAHILSDTDLNFIGLADFGLEGIENHTVGPSLFNFDVMNFSMGDHTDMMEPNLLTPPVMTPNLSLDSSSNSQDSWGIAVSLTHEQLEEVAEKGLGDYSY
jgi:hypothetical protein